MPTPAVASCLTRIRDLLSVDDDYGQQCRTPADLCDLLADGEDLCRVVCVLSGGRLSSTVDDTSSVSFYSENSQLLARRNVSFFLARCVDHFGLPLEALFEPEDLLEARRPDRVVAALQKLLLERERPQSEAAYETMAVVGVAQSVVNEICQSERQLTEKLVTLLRFEKELRGLLSEWSPDLVCLTFQYVEELLRVHEHFHDQLAGLAEQGTVEFCCGLGHLFEQEKPRLAIYAKYYSHYPLAKARLEEEFKAKPLLKHQLRLLEGHFKSEPFSVLFDSALRQMFNYSLMFDRLLELASKELASSEAVDSVEAALFQCKGLLKHFNECKRSSEKAAATQQVLQRVARLPERLARLDEVGLHRADGVFRVKRDQEPPRDCFCLLTDRQIVVASKPGKRDSVTAIAAAAAAAAPPVTSMNYLFSVAITEDLTLEYSADGVLKLQQQQQQHGSTAFTVVVFSKSADAKKSSLTVCNWGQLLSQAKSFNYPDGWNSGGHSFRLQSFPSDSACSRCREALTGYAFQGYGCGHCGMQLDRTCLQVFVRLRPKSYPGAIAARLDVAAAAAAAADGDDARQQLANWDYFHRDLDRGGAERLLQRQPNAAESNDGAFLVRENASKKLVLSIRWRKGAAIFHTIVEQRDEADEAGSDGTSGATPQQRQRRRLRRREYSLEKSGDVWFDSLDSLVAHYRVNQLTIGGVSGVTLGNGVPAAVYANT